MKAIMVGPDLAGQGGISRVVSIWQKADFFSGYQVEYVASCSDSTKKVITMLKGLWHFLTIIPYAKLVYIHTAAYTSFYRKSLFLLLGRLFHRRILLHIHPSSFYDFVSYQRGWRRYYVMFVLGQVTAFVVLTDEMKDNITKLFPQATIHVLRNAVDLKEMADRDNVQREACQVVYLGWYIREKGIYELVDAIELLKGIGLPVHLHFFGTKEKEQLTAYVLQKNLTDIITVHGWIGGAEKVKEMRKSTVLVLPSYSEGIPNVILEAMATETPIVATSVGGMKEVLRDGENALIAKVNDAMDLSKKIGMMLSDPELRTTLATNAFKDASEKYAVSVIRERFRGIISEALN